MNFIPMFLLKSVNAVFNLFTSFGYFDDDEDDRKVFSSVKNVLQNDGIFVLDFLNEKICGKILWLMKLLLPKME